MATENIEVGEEKVVSGKQWKRCHGPNLCYKCEERAKKNLNVFNSQAFKDACEKVGIPATHRQASKFVKKMGKAYRFGRE